MKQNTSLVIGIALSTLIIGSIMMIITSNNKTDKAVMVSSPNTKTYKLDNLQVTYQVKESYKKLYDIQVLGIAKSDPESGDMDTVRISGKACNNQNGNFTVISGDEVVDKIVLKTLEDGRHVLDSPIVSTMMACIDMSGPKYDDAALSKIISDIAKSIESY